MLTLTIIIIIIQSVLVIELDGSISAKRRKGLENHLSRSINKRLTDLFSKNLFLETENLKKERKIILKDICKFINSEIGSNFTLAILFEYERNNEVVIWDGDEDSDLIYGWKENGHSALIKKVLNEGFLIIKDLKGGFKDLTGHFPGSALVGAKIGFSEKEYGVILTYMPIEKMNLESTVAFQRTAQEISFYLYKLEVNEEREESERELKAMRERLIAAMHAGNLAWWELDVRSGELDFDERRATILGYEPEEFKGKKYDYWMNLLEPKDSERAMKTMEDFLNGEISHYELLYRIKAKDGRWRWFHDRGEITERDKKGKPLKVTGVVVDVTELKKAQSKLEELNESMRLLNKTLRHDTLNDLTVVRGSIEIFNETNDRKLLKNAIKSIDKSVEMIKKMKELDCLSSPDDFLKPVDSRKVIEDVVSGYNIDYTIEGDCTVIADDVFMSVIDNLVRNSIKHGKASKLNIKISKGEQGCVIEFSDNGVGVPGEIKDKIFDEGFTTSGTGLGLYISRKTLERYGGSIELTDKVDGATFKIYLKRPVDLIIE